MGVSQSIVSLSSFAGIFVSRNKPLYNILLRPPLTLLCNSGRKRIRVCSGFVIRWNDSTSIGTILTSAALVRPPCGDDVRVSNKFLFFYFFCGEGV